MNKFEMLDKKQREMGVAIKAMLEDRLKTRIDDSYINTNTKTEDRQLIFNIYLNDYDYKQIQLKFDESVSIDEYYNMTLYCSNNEKYYNLHKATVEEIYIHHLIKDKADLYIIDGEFMARNSEATVSFKYITKMEVDIENGIIRFYDEHEITTVDLNKETIEWEDIEESDDKTADEIFIEKLLQEYEVEQIWIDNGIISCAKNDIQVDLELIDNMDYVKNGNCVVFTIYSDDKTIKYMLDLHSEDLIDLEIEEANQLKQQKHINDVITAQEELNQRIENVVKTLNSIISRKELLN